MNCSQIQGSNDPSLLSFDTIKKWGAEVGNNVLKAKTASAKEVEIEKA